MPPLAATASASSTTCSRLSTRSPSASSPTLHLTGTLLRSGPELSFQGPDDRSARAGGLVAGHRAYRSREVVRRPSDSLSDRAIGVTQVAGDLAPAQPGEHSRAIARPEDPVLVAEIDERHRTAILSGDVRRPVVLGDQRLLGRGGRL